MHARRAPETAQSDPKHAIILCRRSVGNAGNECTVESRAAKFDRDRDATCHRARGSKHLPIPKTASVVIALLRRLKGRSLAELRCRGMQAMSARVERVRIHAGLTSFPDFDRNEPLQARSFIGGMVDDSQAGPCSARRTALALAAADGSLASRLRGCATEMKQGRISLMGLGPLSLGNPPDWHRDAQSGRLAPRAHWSRIPYLNSAIVGDHKILWEVNRHQYLLVPAILWNMDGRADDFTLVQDHLASWLDDNPTSMGINWCSSLEVAYRAITWCWLLAMLPEELWNPKIRERLIRSLESHGRHIERYLSYYFSPNTHLTGEALGLLYIGHVLPGSRSARRWKVLGSDILEAWLERQVYDDGVYFEQSTQYQRYTAEIYLHYLRISESNGRTIAPAIRSSLSKQFDVLRAIAAGRGEMPLIGDDDGGALFPIDQTPPEDLRGLLLAGATALKQTRAGAVRTNASGDVVLAVRRDRHRKDAGCRNGDSKHRHPLFCRWRSCGNS